MRHLVELKDIKNKVFWINFFGIHYPNGYDEKTDISVSDILNDLCSDDILKWWDEFTGYYDGILNESDGYSENPTTLKIKLYSEENLIIEFHPGETLYFINHAQIGSIGPHYKLQVLPYKKIKELSAGKQELFTLLLPLALVKKEEASFAKEEIRAILPYYFPEKICDSLAECIICGITEKLR